MVQVRPAFGSGRGSGCVGLLIVSRRSCWWENVKRVQQVRGRPGQRGSGGGCGACRVGTADAPPATCIGADQGQGAGGDARRLNDMDVGWAWLWLAGLTAPVAGVKKHADNNSGQANKRSHEAAQRQVQGKRRRLRNGQDGGGRRNISAYIGIKTSSFPSRGPATHPAGPLSYALFGADRAVVFRFGG